MKAQWISYEIPLFLTVFHMLMANVQSLSAWILLFLPFCGLNLVFTELFAKTVKGRAAGCRERL